MNDKKLDIFTKTLLVFVCGTLTSCSREDDEPREFRSGDALTMCQFALQKASRDPDKADIPYVENVGSGTEFRFVWGPDTKVARMRNGLGLDVATTASCSVDGASKSITMLTVGGKQIL